MLNSKKEKDLICIAITHCDADIMFKGRPKILEEINENKCQRLETLE